MQNLLIGFLLLILALGVLWALTTGVRAGKSTIVMKNTAALKTGIDYFFADQNRYPTAIEFADRNIMADYFSGFPPVAILGGSCTRSYNYSSATAKNFELDFCLPRAAAGYPGGWNKIVK
jgi:hypothetical protein